MMLHFFQGGGVLVLLDEGLDEIEHLFLSLGEHRDEFRFIFDDTILADRVNKKIRSQDLSSPMGARSSETRNGSRPLLMAPLA